MHSKRIGARLLGAFVLILLLLFIVNQPRQAADTTAHIGGWLSDAGNAVGSFLTTIFT
ncbi:hypothetical protein [Qaidamihabitans albus]|uniref:hypothetical protein n=1 Tax=Qaidamihabitans albus TaxID=2795733 RepID=UPI0018F26CBB|nr:hypothetical protein [Qaidamihabitans albus]